MGVLKVTKTNKFLSSIAKHQKEQSKEKFSGFLEDYLAILETDTTIAGLSHKRLYDAITTHGITRLEQSNPRCRRRFYISDSGDLFAYFAADQGSSEFKATNIGRFRQC